MTMGEKSFLAWVENICKSITSVKLAWDEEMKSFDVSTYLVDEHGSRTFIGTDRHIAVDVNDACEQSRALHYDDRLAAASVTLDFDVEEDVED